MSKTLITTAKVGTGYGPKDNAKQIQLDSYTNVMGDTFNHKDVGIPRHFHGLKAGDRIALPITVAASIPAGTLQVTLGVQEGAALPHCYMGIGDTPNSDIGTKEVTPGENGAFLNTHGGAKASAQTIEPGQTKYLIVDVLTDGDVFLLATFTAKK